MRSSVAQTDRHSDVAALSNIVQIHSAIICAMDLMKSRLNSGLTRNLVARSVGLSVSHFSHLFKAETGFTPGQYLKSVRMSKAKHLVDSTDLSLKEISVLVGLDRSHLGREFERLYGASPAKYRSQHKKARSAHNVY
jgi:transcriptional regulator GlxA family with amidase domain